MRAMMIKKMNPANIKYPGLLFGVIFFTVNMHIYME